MAILFVPSLLRAFTGGKGQIIARGATVREVIDSAEQDYPGLRDQLLEDDRLRSNLAVAVDGEVSPMGLLERVGPESEVHFVTAIKGGIAAASRPGIESS